MNPEDDKKWEQGLKKSRGFWGRIRQVFQNRERPDDDALAGLEEILIEADVGAGTALAIVEAVRNARQDSSQKPDEVIRREIRRRLIGPEQPGTPGPSQKPHVILVVGVNGTGKTTTIGKLAHRYRQAGKRVIVAAADTFRAAAGEQLEAWANRAGADLVRQSHGADPAAVAFDALDAAIARGADVLIVDTAGRLHNKSHLMEELKKIARVLSRRMENAPHETLLVLDATTGQNGLTQSKTFAEAVPVTGIVLTKLDGTARGGIVIAIRQDLGIPVRFIGLGEGIGDLVPFDPVAFVEGLVGNPE
ncbi:MAG TPA: signal recognition particle-docking protein FtsY [bacterium]|nr:signal recognition particle-docking protein FtsY [bacterium]